MYTCWSSLISVNWVLWNFEAWGPEGGLLIKARRAEVDAVVLHNSRSSSVHPNRLLVCSRQAGGAPVCTLRSALAEGGCCSFQTLSSAFPVVHIGSREFEVGLLLSVYCVESLSWPPI